MSSYTERKLHGQAAIEYLMTYGWMLLAVAVIGTSAWQAIGFQCVPSVSGESQQGLEINDFAVNDRDELLLSLENNGQETAEVERVVVRGDLAGVWRPSEPGETLDLARGERDAIVIGEGFEASDETCSEMSVEVKFDTGPLEDIQFNGGMVGPIDGDGEEPSAPSNVELD